MEKRAHLQRVGYAPEWVFEKMWAMLEKEGLNKPNVFLQARGDYDGVRDAIPVSVALFVSPIGVFSGRESFFRRFEPNFEKAFKEAIDSYKRKIAEDSEKVS